VRGNWRDWQGMNLRQRIATAGKKIYSGPLRMTNSDKTESVAPVSGRSCGRTGGILDVPFILCRTVLAARLADPFNRS